MKILVTGGAGFIGSHVAEALVDQGHTVHIIDDLSSGRKEQVPTGAELWVTDIRSPAAATLIRDRQFDVLVHHAAQMDVRASVADPGRDAEINIQGFLNVMEAARGQGLQKVIFASTGGAIYGEPVYAPQDEDHPLRPLSPYGITKLATEKYLDFYRHQYGIDAVVMRYANVYGPRQNAHGDAGVVAIFSQLMLQDEWPTINGTGEQTRDYVFVGDVVRANLAALDYEGSGTFNIGTGREVSVNALYKMIRAEVGADTRMQYGPGKPGEQQRSVLDYSRAEVSLGWRPTVSVRDGIGRTVAWFRSQRDLAAPAASDVTRPPVSTAEERF
jgi:UDP-glucose 4-epimerase